MKTIEIKSESLTDLISQLEEHEDKSISMAIHRRDGVWIALVEFGG